MRTVFNRFAVSAMTVAVLLFAGCSSQSTQPAANPAAEAAKKPAGPPALIPAKTAFWPMYTAARSWAPDIETLRVTAEEVPGFKYSDGKAAMWQAAFASPSLHQYRVYTYSIAAVPPDIQKGVDAGLALPWGGESRDVMPVDLSALNVDSDAAYSAAAADAAAWLKKNPTKMITEMELGDTYRFQGPVWYLVWGDSKSGGYVAYIDANSGKVLKRK